MTKKLDEPISLEEELKTSGETFLNDLYKFSKETKRKEATPAKKEEEATSFVSFTPPPVLEATRDQPTDDGKVGVKFSSKLIVPGDLKDVINRQNRRRMMRSLQESNN